MSHLPERKEKNCLNCNAELFGKYCHFCGQENREPVESAWHLIKHFFYDLFHFDGKFFHTLKFLILKPGVVPREYMRGRRYSFLDPIRMYIFTSAVFFLIFFSVYDSEVDVASYNTDYIGKDDSVNYSRIYRIKDSSEFANETAEINNGVPMVREKFVERYDSLQEKESSTYFDSEYETHEEYDSSLKAGENDGWITRMLVHKSIDLREKYSNNNQLIGKTLLRKLIHLFPQLFFISLPLYALVLKLLYVRRKFYYSHHIIFSLYLYILSFIGMAGVIGVSKLEDITGYGVFTIITVFMFFYLLLYELFAFRNFYGQSFGKTFAKYVLAQFLRLLIFVLLLVIFFILSFFQV